MDISKDDPKVTMIVVTQLKGKAKNLVDGLLHEDPTYHDQKDFLVKTFQECAQYHYKKLQSLRCDTYTVMDYINKFHKLYSQTSLDSAPKGFIVLHFTDGLQSGMLHTNVKIHAL